MKFWSFYSDVNLLLLRDICLPSDNLQHSAHSADEESYRVLLIICLVANNMLSLFPGSFASFFFSFSSHDVRHVHSNTTP